MELPCLLDCDWVLGYPKYLVSWFHCLLSHILVTLQQIKLHIKLQRPNSNSPNQERSYNIDTSWRCMELTKLSTWDTTWRSLTLPLQIVTFGFLTWRGGRVRLVALGLLEGSLPQKVVKCYEALESRGDFMNTKWRDISSWGYKEVNCYLGLTLTIK